MLHFKIRGGGLYLVEKKMFLDLPFMVLVLFRSFVLHFVFFVFCFVHVRFLGLGYVIMRNKTKLRTKPMIRNDRL